MARLGHPERDLPPVIHVAGTNGKGSTIAFLRAMLEAAGASVHQYTSPHLMRFHERIRLGRGPGQSEFITEGALGAALDECEQKNAGGPITFFEVTTAAAFLAFARAPADVLLLEVGLGGRLDATNLVDRPALSVITPISVDHVGFLGADLAGIAGEKAGICKPGVAAVVGPQEPEAAAGNCRPRRRGGRARCGCGDGIGRQRPRPVASAYGRPKGTTPCQRRPWPAGIRCRTRDWRRLASPGLPNSGWTKRRWPLAFAPPIGRGACSA